MKLLRAGLSECMLPHDFAADVTARRWRCPRRRPRTTQTTNAVYTPLSVAHAHLQLVAREKWMPPPQEKVLHGVDIFLEWASGSPDELAAKLQAATKDVSTRLSPGGTRGIPTLELCSYGSPA